MPDDSRLTKIHDIVPGAILEVTVEGTTKIVADYDEYGTIELNLHPGATVRFIIGTKVPKIISLDPDRLTLEGGNIFRIDEQEPDNT